MTLKGNMVISASAMSKIVISLLRHVTQRTCRLADRHGRGSGVALCGPASRKLRGSCRALEEAAEQQLQCCVKLPHQQNVCGRHVKLQVKI